MTEVKIDTHTGQCKSGYDFLYYRKQHKYFPSLMSDTPVKTGLSVESLRKLDVCAH
jgi:hypothetical protein